MAWHALRLLLLLAAAAARAAAQVQGPVADLQDVDDGRLVRFAASETLCCHGHNVS